MKTRAPFLLTFSFMLSLNSFAATDADTLRELEEKISAQEKTLKSLKAQIKQLKEGKSPDDASKVVTKTSKTPTAQEKKSATTNHSIELYGHIQLDAIYDFKRVDPTWESTLRPSSIPTTDGAFGDDGQSIFSVKQTQFGFKGKHDTPLGSMSSWFEFDFFGTGSDAGDTKFNLRHAWIEVGGLGFGQTNSNFMDISIFPNVVDWWGPSGMVFNRNPQVRYTWAQSSSEIAIALEKPNGSFNTGIFGDISPEFDDNAKAKSSYPDLTSHWRDEYQWGHYQIAAVLRRLEVDVSGPNGTAGSDSDTGWGINLTSVVNTLGRDQLKLGLVYGEGIASFMNDGGVNLAPDNFQAKAVPIMGLSAYYDRYWSQQWSSSIGISINDADPSNQQADDEFASGFYASTNLLYAPYPELLIGAEFLYGQHEDVGGDKGEDYRIQFTFKHKLGSSL